MVKKKQQNSKPSGPNRRRRFKTFEKRTDRVYLEGNVIETLPGTKFKVRIPTVAGKDPLIVDCQVKTFFKLKRIKIIRGDKVEVEIDPANDIDTENNKAQGTIIKRII